MQITDIFAVPTVGLMALWFAGDYGDKPTNAWGTLTSSDNGATWTQTPIESGLTKAQWPTEPAARRLPRQRAAVRYCHTKHDAMAGFVETARRSAAATSGPTTGSGLRVPVPEPDAGPEEQPDRGVGRGDLRHPLPRRQGVPRIGMPWEFRRDDRRRRRSLYSLLPLAAAGGRGRCSDASARRLEAGQRSCPTSSRHPRSNAATFVGGAPTCSPGPFPRLHWPGGTHGTTRRRIRETNRRWRARRRCTAATTVRARSAPVARFRRRRRAARRRSAPASSSSCARSTSRWRSRRRRSIAAASPTPVPSAILPRLAQQSRELAEFAILGGLLTHYARSRAPTPRRRRR